jgi:hypothetical protein
MWIAAGIAVVATGCAGPRVSTMPTPRALGSDMPSFHTAQDGTEGRETGNALDPQQVLTLDNAVALALLRSPELAKARSKMSAVQTSLETELSEAYAKLTIADRRALTLREKVVPAMDETFKATHTDYTQGKFGFLDMLDAQRGLFEATGELVEALLAHHVALAEIQRITGTSIKELMSSKPKEMR